jgi:hypothetical protein
MGYRVPGLKLRTTTNVSGNWGVTGLLKWMTPCYTKRPEGNKGINTLRCSLESITSTRRRWRDFDGAVLVNT